MTGQEDVIILGKIDFDDNKQEKKSWACLGQTCSRSLIAFLSQLFVIFLPSLNAFGESTFEKLVLNQLFVLESCAMRQDTFYIHHDYEQVHFYTKWIFISLVPPSEPGKPQLIYNWLKIGTFQPKFDKIYFLINILKLFTMLWKMKWKFSSLCKE